MLENDSSKINGFFKIMRPFNSLLAGLATFIGIEIAIGFDSISFYVLEILLACFATSFIAAGGYVINDFFDLEIDKINQPHRVLPSELLTAREAYRFAISLFVMGFLFSIVLAVVEKADIGVKILTPFLALFGIVCLYTYASFFKRVGGVGNIIVTVLVMIPLVYGGIIINQFQQSVYPIVVAFTLMLGREIVKDIEDIRGDEIGTGNNNISTLPMVIGIRNTARLGQSILIIFLICSPSVFFFPELKIFQSWGLLLAIVIVDIIVLYSIVNIRGNEEEMIKRATFSKKLLKSALAIGVLGLISASFTPFNQLNFLVK